MGAGQVRVLIVEDNADDVSLATEYISRTGIPVAISSVDDGEKAVNVFERSGAHSSEVPELVLLDLNVPKRNGLEVLKSIRDQHGNTKVYVYSGSSSPEEMKKAKGAGADGYIIKPMSKREIDSVVNEFKDILSSLQNNRKMAP